MLLKIPMNNQTTKPKIKILWEKWDKENQNTII